MNDADARRAATWAKDPCTCGRPRSGHTRLKRQPWPATASRRVCEATATRLFELDESALTATEAAEWAQRLAGHRAYLGELAGPVGAR